MTRGWKDRMHFIDYEELTRHPDKVLGGIHEFLELQPFKHEFDRVEQVTHEDDFVYGFKDLHQIRAVVKPQEPQSAQTFDDAVFQSAVWKNVEHAATFWRVYGKDR